jgi:hypothetical protein
VRNIRRRTVLNLFKEEEATIAMRRWNRAGKDLTVVNKICGLLLSVWELRARKNVSPGGVETPS